MPESNAEDTSRIDRAEVDKVAQEEAERAAFDLAGRTAERPCLIDWSAVARIRKPGTTSPG